MRSGLAKYINSIHEIASFFCFFLLLLSLHFFSILTFCFFAREFGLLYSTLLCRFPLCSGARFCLLVWKKMYGWMIGISYRIHSSMLEASDFLCCYCCYLIWCLPGCGCWENDMVRAV